MNNSDILDACLKAIEREEATVNDCVARYPHVEGLRELLIAAHDARTMGRPIMSMAARTLLEQRLITKMKSSPRGSRRFARLWPRVPVTLAATVLLILVMAAGLLRLSGGAIPGDILYGIKRTAEQVSLAFASAPERPAVLAQIADARLGELATLASRGWPMNKALPDAMSSLYAAAAAQPVPAVRAALYAKGIQTMAQLAASGHAAPSLMAALLGIATPTVTPTLIVIDTATDAPRNAATAIVTDTVTPVPTRIAPRVPTRIPPTVQPTPVPPTASNGGNGGSNDHPNQDKHEDGSSHEANDG